MKPGLGRLLAVMAVIPIAACVPAEPPATLETESLREGQVAGAALALPRWKWADITSHMGEIRDAGFTAILLPPHTSTCAGGYSAGYDPYDFTNFNSGFGSEADLRWLIGTAHGHGVEIYADMIMNHMCPRDYTYPRFGWNDFHHNGGIQNWNDPWERENKDMFGLNDLAQESPYVRKELFDYMVKTNNLGFDGYRWDGIKHAPLWYWRDHVMNNVNSWGKFSVGEVYDSNLGLLQEYADAGMSVTDYNLYDAMLRSFKYTGDLSQLDGAGYAARNGARAVTFVENHDVGPPQNSLLAYAFLSAYVGYPFYQDRVLTDPAIRTLAWIHTHKAQGSYVNRWKERDLILFERQGNLLAGINQSGEWQGRWIDTSWSNTKLHDYTGHAADVSTARDGRVQVWVPPMSYVMLAP